MTIRKSQHLLEGKAEAPWRQWGKDHDPEAVNQIRAACRLPISVAGALMPDAHLGYGLPIGGVLATSDAVIPYAVGVDIACRVKLSVLDLPVGHMDAEEDRLRQSLNHETRFGIGAKFKIPRNHEVMDADWNVSPVTRSNRDRAWHQLGSSGSGNHFVEFGLLRIESTGLSLPVGEYFALMSHSGSRGTGAAVCSYYSRVAKEKHPDLPRDQRYLAWLDLASDEGNEYWEAMKLMGLYASANHACIHDHIARYLGGEILHTLENHHNFAWKEKHYGRELIVHRKGATPASMGEFGIIPGSMATPAFIVRGLGNYESLNSAAHGAGRTMSRRQAKKRFTWQEVQPLLRKNRVSLMSAGLDEVPMAYKDIHTVMAAQADLVEPLAQFHPRLVKMAPAGERPED